MAEFDNIYMHGFVRAAAASPRVYLADPASNARETIDLMRKADKAGAALVIFPELGLSGYTIDDLHLQSTLLSAVLDAIAKVKEASRSLAPGKRTRIAEVTRPGGAKSQVFVTLQ